MAWRPNEQFIEGILDNTVPGKVTGWMRFSGMNENVIFNLEGDFHRDIRGAKVRLHGDGQTVNQEEAVGYMEGFSKLQKGKVGDMTAGRPPQDYVNYGYFEWYSEDNGRCVLELEPRQIELLTQPIPVMESEPHDRKQQAENMAQFLGGMAEAIGIPQENAIAVGNTIAVEHAKKVLANDKIRGIKLLPKEIRDTLPALYSQDGKGGQAIAYVKFFTPDSNWTWYVTEYDGDDTFFGLVDGLVKEFGYFSLRELECSKGPIGLPVERDLHWQPKTLAQIAPELFEED
jgi:hypothetical protein